jgi:hypothetical protein
MGNAMPKVQGQRSPRWAFMARFTIPCRDGTDYLVRLRVLQTPWGGCYVHDIHEDDGDRAPHNHPWSFFSFVARGHYVERYYPKPIEQPDYYVLKCHRRFSVHRMGRTAAHRIVEAGPGLKTVILVGPRKASWGFFEDGCYSDWRDYERRLGTL